MDRLVLATHNPGKVAEFAALLAPLGITVVAAGELGLPEPEETADTFEGNSVLKAEAARDATGLPALADDSGVTVAALGGAPGIYSARWAGPGKDFAVAMRRVLDGVAAAGGEDRRAAFVAVLALATPGAATRTWEGRVDGTLAASPCGSQGFGYDPIFIPEQGDGRTFGEMSAEEKHGGSTPLSHRARAVARFLATLREEAP